MFKTSNKIADIFLNILDINIFYTAYFLIINLNWTVSIVIKYKSNCQNWKISPSVWILSIVSRFDAIIKLIF